MNNNMLYPLKRCVSYVKYILNVSVLSCNTCRRDYQCYFRAHIALHIFNSFDFRCNTMN